jgi:hypothetical protein
MPGPANEKGRKKRQNKKQKAKKSAPNSLAEPSISTLNNTTAQSPPESALCVSSARDERPADRTPPVYRSNTAIHEGDHREHSRRRTDDNRYVIEGEERGKMYERREGEEEGGVEEDGEVGLLESSASYIYDPGNGPRVRDFFAFLRSPFAAEQGISFVDVGSDETTVPLGDSGEGRREEEEGERYSAAKVIPVLNRFLPGEFATVRGCWCHRFLSVFRCAKGALTDSFFSGLLLRNRSFGSTGLVEHSGYVLRVNGYIILETIYNRSYHVRKD